MNDSSEPSLLDIIFESSKSVSNFLDDFRFSVSRTMKSRGKHGNRRIQIQYEEDQLQMKIPNKEIVKDSFVNSNADVAPETGPENVKLEGMPKIALINQKSNWNVAVTLNRSRTPQTIPQQRPLPPPRQPSNQNKPNNTIGQYNNTAQPIPRQNTQMMSAMRGFPSGFTPFPQARAVYPNINPIPPSPSNRSTNPQPQPQQLDKQVTFEGHYENEVSKLKKNRQQQITNDWNFSVNPNPNIKPPQNYGQNHGPGFPPKNMQAQNVPANSRTPSKPKSNIYINQNIMKGKFGVMYDSGSLQNIPLLLDKSDRSLTLTDDSSTANRASSSIGILEWDKLFDEDLKYYSVLKKMRPNGFHFTAQHSDPAINLFLIEPNFTDFEHFHHPQIFIDKINGIPQRITTKKIKINEDAEVTISPYLKTYKSLSGKRGFVYVIEHTAESPPFITNVGMASQLLVYYHKENSTDQPRISENNLYILEPDQASPFVGQIKRNQPFRTLTCHLYNVPVAKHPPNRTDFLLVRSMKKHVFIIRRIDDMYCAGLLEAHQVVMRPGTKEAQKFNQNFIKAVLINIFRGTDQYKGRQRIQVANIIKEFFPDVNEPKLRQALKEFAYFYREQGNGFWEIRKGADLENHFQAIDIDSEKVCSYQSMQVGHWKLRKSGVNLLIRSKRVFQNIQKLNGKLTKDVADKIELELMKTPWARTANFTKAFEGLATQIQNTEDGVSIVRTKGRRGRGDTQDNNQKAPNKKTLANTNADLRALTLRQLREELQKFGVQSQKIDNMGRWKQVNLLRELANAKAEGGSQNDATERFARGPRNDYAASVEKYKKQYQQTFDNNLVFITSSAEENDNNFDDGDGLDNIGLEMAREDSEEEESFAEDVDSSTIPNEEPRIDVSGDPPELKPNGLYTSHLKIEWARLGFSDIPMRKALKLIHISLDKGCPTVSLQWKRSPPQIAEFERLSAYVNLETNVKGFNRSDDLETLQIKDKRKQLLDKLRRTKQTIRSKGEKSLVVSYLQCDHQVLLVNDPEGTLSFEFSQDMVNLIREASNRFDKYIQSNNKQHSNHKKKKTTTNVHSEEESNDEVEITKSQRRSKPNPVVSFNKELKSIIEYVMKYSVKYSVFEKPVSKKDAPNYYNVIRQPKCFQDIEREINNDRYTNVNLFYRDVQLIRTNCIEFNRATRPDLVDTADEMWKVFSEKFNEKRSTLDELEKSIDPIQKI